MLLGVAAVLKSLAWPIVAVVAISLYRNSIQDFLKRIQKWEATPTSIRTEMSPASQIETLKDAQTTEEPKASIEFAPLDPAYELEYAKVTEAINNNKSTNPTDRVEAAKRMFAVASTQKQFELIHRLIFNSQFQAVNAANQLGGKIPRTELHRIYTEAAVRFPAVYTNIPFEQWLQYLFDTKLLVNIGPIANLLNYEVTPFGRAYLAYSVGAQLPPRTL